MGSYLSLDNLLHQAHDIACGQSGHFKAFLEIKINKKWT